MIPIIKEALFDSNIFIAAWHKRDEHNEHCVALLQKIAQGEIQQVYITNYVLVEVTNFLIKKVPFELALQAYEYLTKTDRIKIVYVDKIMEYEIRTIFSQYKTLTLTDSSLVALAQELGIKEIYSLDSGFDKVKGVVRK